MDAEKKQQYADLERLNKNYDEITISIATKQAELNQLTKEKEELTQLKDSLTRLETQVETYKSDNKRSFQKYGINIDDLIKVDFNKELVSIKLRNKKEEISKVNRTLRTKESIDSDLILQGQPEKLKEAYDLSLLIQIKNIEKQITTIKNVLSKPEKDFQEYKEKLAKWEKRKKEIEGTETDLNTLMFLKSEKKYIDNVLPETLSTKRKERLDKTLEIFQKKKEIIELYKTFKVSIDNEITKDKDFTKKFKMEIDVNFKLDPTFATVFLQYINKTKGGTYLGATEKDVDELFNEKDLLSEEEISDLLEAIINSLEKDKRDTTTPREISDQIGRVQEFYDFIFSLDYLIPIYELKLDDKILNELSPGEKGALLLVFYLMIDKEDIPLIIDQPEDNLDNKSVFQVLTHFIKNAKQRRQIIIVTHNPNLAVGADAEQIIYVELDKKDKKNIFSYQTGSIESPEINAKLVEILEGTMPAFDKRKLRYREV